MTYMGSALTQGNEQNAAYLMFSKLANAIDEGRVSYAKFQIDVTLPGGQAEEIDSHAADIGAQTSRTDL